MAIKICPVCGNETDEYGYCFHHCHFCFKPLHPGDGCSCGFEEKVRPAAALPLESTLENGKYIIGAVLGKGGFGITYLAYQKTLHSRVAIKECYPSQFVVRGRPENRYALVPNSRYYEEFLEKFEREANILREFNDLENIVTVHDLIEENNTAYFVMEYVEGESLKQRLRKSGSRMQWAELQKLMDPIMESLARIHERGIIHRDIAPDNIMIRNNGKPVLIDFGAARVGSHTGGTIALGKDGYAPLEQMSGRDKQDKRTDIYALGATFYNALTGVVPESARNRATHNSLQPVKELAPDVPQHVSDAIMKALSISLTDRWDDVDAFREALNREPDTYVPQTTKPPVSTGSIEEPAKNTTKIPVDPADPGQTVKPPDPEPLSYVTGLTLPDEKKKRVSFGKVLLTILLAVAVLGLAGFIAANLLYPEKVDNILSRVSHSFRAKVQNDPESQLWLGQHYFSGTGGFERSPEKSDEWVRKALDQDYLDAVLWKAETAETDEEKLEWYTRAADAGDTGAMLWIAHHSSYEESIEWYQKAAELGNAEAMYELAYDALYARNDTEDYEYWLQEAGKHGNQEAILEMYDMALGYLRQGDSYHYEQWLVRAAECGYEEAILDLIDYYENEEPDPDSADYWKEVLERTEK